jgi:hypothetical protein
MFRSAGGWSVWERVGPDAQTCYQKLVVICFRPLAPERCPDVPAPGLIALAGKSRQDLLRRLWECEGGGKQKPALKSSLGESRKGWCLVDRLYLEVPLERRGSLQAGMK